MKKILLSLCIVVTFLFSSFCFAESEIIPFESTIPNTITINDTVNEVSLNKINDMLQSVPNKLSSEAIERALIALKCADDQGVAHNNILTIIDYSLPSNVKRLWVFDLMNYKLLFNTYVSHGVKTGALLSTYFSNEMNSKESSIGVYDTENSYFGRDGLSLKLDGLDKGFNDNAYHRFIVMHGAWYVEESFIKKYGRPGRSWGCPAIPLSLVEPIINTIKDNSIFVINYPNMNWISKSKFLNCDSLSSVLNSLNTTDSSQQNLGDEEFNLARDEIFFADIKNNGKRDDNSAVVAISVDDYQRLINSKVPLNRMLRRQIDGTEYIALNNPELRNIIEKNNNALRFIIANVILKHGFFETQLKFKNFGTIKDVKINSDGYRIYFENGHSINIRSTRQFLRWVGV